MTVFARPRVELALNTCTVTVAGSAGRTPVNELVGAKRPREVTIDVVVGVVAVVLVDLVDEDAVLFEPELAAGEVGELLVVLGLLVVVAGAGPGALQLVEAAGTGLSTWNQATAPAMSSTAMTTRIGARRRRWYRSAGESGLTGSSSWAGLKRPRERARPEDRVCGRRVRWPSGKAGAAVA